jgi:hypothetical protein
VKLIDKKIGVENLVTFSLESLVITVHIVVSLSRFKINRALNPRAVIY